MVKILIVIVAVALTSMACENRITSPSSPFASCNGKPPGQQPSGNPAHAPGNSSSLDKDCK